MQFYLLLADQLINQDGLFEAALKTIDRIGNYRDPRIWNGFGGGLENSYRILRP
jgi:hypothetical protein